MAKEKTTILDAKTPGWEHVRFIESLADIFKAAGIDTNPQRRDRPFISAAMAAEALEAMHNAGYRIAKLDGGVCADAVPTASGFLPDSSIIRGGEVRLNKISPYLADLPDTATAELLIAPEDLAEIDDQAPDTWVNSIRRIRQIHGYHGLDGMKIFDSPQAAPETSYEKDLSRHIRTAFNQAQATNRNVVTGLFMPTKELLHGRKADDRETMVVGNNLYALKNKIAHEGRAFTTDISAELSVRFYWSGTEEGGKNPCDAFLADITRGDGILTNKNGVRLSSRPVSLEIRP